MEVGYIMPNCAFESLPSLIITFIAFQNPMVHRPEGGGKQTISEDSLNIQAVGKSVWTAEKLL